MYRILVCRKFNPTPRATVMVNTQTWEVQRHGWYGDDLHDGVCAQPVMPFKKMKGMDTECYR